MWRRGFLLLAPVLALRGDSRSDALDAVAPVAAALAEGDAGLALSVVPKSDPKAPQLRANITALLAQSAVTSSVDVIASEPGRAELDWYMEIRSRETEMVVERRRGVVTITHRKGKLLSLGPASFFAPPSVLKRTL